jgi:Rps23 Pro-64 3,4-dihydroxylase Tpa1-like proline 4-hydroxylase
MLTKKNIEDAGFLNVDQIEDNIFYIKNFLSNEEIDSFIKKIKDIPETSWSILNKQHGEGFYNKFYDHDDEHTVTNIINKINDIKFNLSKICINGFSRILRQSPGDYMQAHVDEINDQPNGAIREYAAVLYLNDSYVGGELSYVNLNISIKPEAGSLMIFKTGPKYLHEVKTVLGNTPRYCLPAFIFSSWVDNGKG